ncbi:MAG: hypothetical protein RLZZ251_768 [Actinomycetota bacterium]
MRSWPSTYLPPALVETRHPSLSLRDSYSGELVEVLDNPVSMYVCGITPYDATHLGHAATYLTFDLINRYLLASGKSVAFTENITDIDDPLFQRAKRDGVDWRSLGTSQIDLFATDMTELRVLPPQNYRGVIESINDVITSVAKLIETGKTYSLAQDIYLDFSKIQGALEELPLEQAEAIRTFAERGGDPERVGKRHPLDPLLWKSESHPDISWHTAFGQGRPGWHIECVAIALNYLPEKKSSSISIQGGGSDLKFPHHYMTAVQARAATGKQFSHLYLHCGMIGLDGEKMSKSKGNLVFVSKLLQSGISPMAIRIALLWRHYRADTMWSDSILEAASALIERLNLNLSRTEVAPTSNVIQEIVDALAHDLDTVKVFEILKSWCSDTESGKIGGEAGELSRALDLYLGIAL